MFCSPLSSSFFFFFSHHFLISSLLHVLFSLSPFLLLLFHFSFFTRSSFVLPIIITLFTLVSYLSSFPTPLLNLLPIPFLSSFSALYSFANFKNKTEQREAHCSRREKKKKENNNLRTS